MGPWDKVETPLREKGRNRARDGCTEACRGVRVNPSEPTLFNLFQGRKPDVKQHLFYKDYIIGGV